MLELEEYRYLDGWSRDKKKGSSRCERLPAELAGEIYINNPSDYAGLIPQGLPTPFTSKNFAKAVKLSFSAAQTALNVLNYVGAVERTGKRGNMYLYETKHP
jgi:hypothetical protein